NRDTVGAIAGSAAAHVQASGGVRDGRLLDEGVARVVLGSLVLANRSHAAELIAQHPGQVAVGLDHRDGELRVRGWEEGGGVYVLDALGWPELAGAAAFVVTNIARDGTLDGPD